MFLSGDYFADNFEDKLLLPYVFFPHETLAEKVVLAEYILTLEPPLLLLPTATAFTYEPILAGLNEKQIEYFAKNAPDDYKKEVINSLSQDFIREEIFAITQAMDEKIRTNQNQQRIRNVIQYIKDNQIAFQF